ncbi:MAG: PhnD/SsuA/transferrin family substrate-binding protein [Methylibium sp.]|uniref:PhnD/SsuA/transferrin family substrate-binding protein n=1 Tax=Methylibium sp. TaxID=2067992 RepID=UPI0017AF1862|nr:PhnD/SsuA/transferrin family substrate-binding protein [Methylibium sp.]MBA3596497.1 PhnD/SsuA/transferrin family substrate-binding protein [Methylibium sp.]
MRRTLLKLTVLALAGLAARATPAAEPPPLAFGVITTTLGETQAAWEPFFEFMHRSTGLDVRGIHHATYEAAVDALATELVPLAWVSSKAALDCIERANVEVIAQQVHRPDANSRTRAHFNLRSLSWP